MPLKPGTSPQTITDNISETLESPTFAPDKPKRKRHQMAVAAAMSKKQDTLSKAAFRRKKK